MSQSKDEKHLSTPFLRQKGLEGPFGKGLTRERDGLNQVPSPAVHPEKLVKLNDKHDAFHKPGIMARPPENPCQEWNLEQTLWSTIPRLEESEALDTSTTASPS